MAPIGVLITSLPIDVAHQGLTFKRPLRAVQGMLEFILMDVFFIAWVRTIMVKGSAVPAGERDVSSYSRDKFVARHHCHRVICDFTRDINE